MSEMLWFYVLASSLFVYLYVFIVCVFYGTIKQIPVYVWCLEDLESLFPAKAELAQGNRFCTGSCVCLWGLPDVFRERAQNLCFISVSCRRQLAMLSREPGRNRLPLARCTSLEIARGLNLVAATSILLDIALPTGE